MANQDQTQSSDVQLNAIARGAENFLRWSSSAMLRGGRVTKFKGVSASYSPELGLVSCGAERGLVAGGVSATLTLGMVRRLLRWTAAPVALLAAGSPAFAQAQDECVEVTPDNFVCEDNGDPATVTQDLGVLEQDVNVLLQDGFEVDTSGGTGDGINISEAYDVSISQESGTSTITGDDDGISVTGSYGSIDITTGGDVTGVNGDGIRADNNAADGIDDFITIDSRAGTVRGRQDGINASNFGGGDLSITTADVYGERGDGINVSNAAGSGDIDIDTTAGTVFGQYGGIVTQNQGDGATTIITADVDTGYGEGGILDGINAVNGTSATDLTIDSSAGTVTGQNRGIFVRNNGTGDTTITTGDVDGESGDGINVRSESAAGDLTIDSSAGRVRGQNRGILARNNGTGDTTISTADVSGLNGTGIDVETQRDGGDLLIDSTAGNVSGQQAGIDVSHRGENATIRTGNVYSAGGTGVEFISGIIVGAVSLDTSGGRIVGQTDGINLYSGTRVGASIVTGDVEGTDGNGIDAELRGEAGTGADLTINSSAGSVTGGTNGILASHEGSGVLSITTADVTGLSASGIDATSFTEGLTIDSAAGTVSGNSDGISAFNRRDGVLSITTADVTGATGDGINASNEDDATDIIIDSSAGAVLGDDNGIFARNNGTGDTAITTADVDGEDGNGIDVQNAARTGNLSVDSSAGTVNGDQSGIRAEKLGVGSVLIVTADVVGNFGDGIDVYRGEGGSGALSIDTSAGTVGATGGDGIGIENVTANSVSITTADVNAVASGSGEGGDGINLNQDFREAETVAVATTGGTITGSNYGINVLSRGHDLLSITTGDVAGGRDGIRVSAEGPEAGDIDIDTTAGTVTSQNSSGIFVSNNGSGDLTITTADVSGRQINPIGGGYGIFADSTGGSITINSVGGDVSGADDGIFARVDGSGGISITTANVIATGFSGINAQLSNTDGDAVIDTSAGAVTGDDDAIVVRNDGSGDTLIITGDVTGITSDGINVSNGTTAGNLTIDSSAGTVTGDSNGIFVRNEGSGAVSITTADVSGYSAGIAGDNYGTDFVIDSSAGDVAGDEFGLEIDNFGSGITSITTANVTGGTDAGIGVRHDAADLIINTAAGSVTGGTAGISARNRGSGNTVITTGDVDGEDGSGVEVDAGASSGDVVIDTSAGEVNAFQFGIDVDQYGSGDITVTTADVTTEANTGIRISGAGGNIAINTTAGTVDGSQGGITVFNNGAAGNISVTTADVVSTSFDTDAVYVSQRGGDVSVDTSAGEVSGAAGGVEVRNRGTGDTTITTGAVNSSRGYGVEGVNSAGSGDLTIDTSAGAVVGRFGGISASNQGTGNTSITTADVDGYGELGVGIDARNGRSASDLTIDSSAGSVIGQDEGIDALNQGSGIVSVVTGNVTGQDGDGVKVGGNANVSAILVDTSAGAVSGAQYGVNVDNNGYGAATVITGDVYAANRDGIDVSDDGENGAGLDGTDITIDSSAGSVTGGEKGIHARNFDTGDLTIITGDVTGLSNEGIDASNASDKGDLNIDTTAGAVTGQENGIQARNFSTGDTTITTGDVSSYGESGDAIEAVNEGENLVIDTTAGRVYTYDATAIRATNNGTGITSITTGEVYSQTGGTAIRVSHSGSDVTVNTTAGSVTAGGRNSAGIVVTNSGSGNTIITTGDVSGGYIDRPEPGFAQGIYATNQATSGDLTIDSTSGDVVGESEGIRATNNSAGNTIIRTGNVSGNRIGIIAINTNADAISGDLTIDSSAGSVAGSYRGISVDHYGTGDISVITADVSATDGDAVNVNDNGEEGAGVDVAIDSTQGTVTGGRNGIYAANSGTGDLSITTADVIGTAGVGIDARNVDSATGDLTIDSSAGAVTGNSNGIDARNDGTGDTTITTAGVTANGGIAIRVDNGANTDGVSVDTTAGDIYSRGALSSAIVVSHQGTGDIDITTADVFGSGGGVQASNATGSGDISIDTTAGAVDGGFYGISAFNTGVGRVMITTANVSAYSNVGIAATNDSATSTDIVIDSSAGSVTSGGDGINVNNSGTGYTRITTAGVTGNNSTGDGISVNNGTLTTDIIIDSTAGSIIGGSTGISATTTGSGDISITTADATGGYLYGILAENGPSSGAVTVDSSGGTVTGNRTGVLVRTLGDGEVSITTADVVGEGSFGIAAFRSVGEGNLLIDSIAGVVTGSDSGIIVRNPGGGNASIITANVIGQYGDGIDLTDEGELGSDGGDVTIDSTLGTVTGGENGIVASNFGTGDLSITTADVNGESGVGIRAENAVGTDMLTVNSSAGAVSAEDDGLFIRNEGSGDTLIITGDVTSASAAAIDVIGGSNAGALTIDTTGGALVSAQSGIDARNESGGDVSIRTGDITTTDPIRSFGVEVRQYPDNPGGEVLVDTTAGTLNTASFGVFVGNRSAGAGANTVLTGDITAGNNAISVFFGGDDNHLIDSTAGELIGGRFGIYVNNDRGTGDLTITTADTTGETLDGIRALHEGADLVIDSVAGAVSGDDNGVFARHTGTGAIVITTANVTGLTEDGVNMVTGADTGTLVIDTSAGAVVGGSRGIYANHGGTEDLTITVGNVTGQGAEGILASTSQDTANILIQGGEGIASNVIGATTGIAASTEGADITVTALDSVTGQDGDGLNLVSNGGDITVTDIGTIAGLNGNGIFADSVAGNISIQDVGLVGGITAIGGIGIAAYASDGGTINIGTSGGIGTVLGETYGANGETDGDTGNINIDVSAFPVTGAIGINAVNSGDDSTNVTSADVTGTAGEGINASTVGTDVVVNSVAGTVTGLTDGITAANMGSGSTTIITAAVTGTVDDGIDAYNGNDTTDLTIDSTSGAVTGGDDGVYAVNNGSGTTTVTTADVTGTAGNGIDVIGRGSDLLVDTTAGTVTGGQDGIDAANIGTGTTTITTADVTGQNGAGIRVGTGSDAGDIVVNSSAGSVSGSTQGIQLNNFGTGNATLVTANVTGASGDGISINDDGEGGIYGADMTVDTTAGAVTGNSRGISADNRGTGDLTITTADVSGTTGNGIVARNQAGTGDLTIDTLAGTVSGGDDGIDARNEGTGALAITTGDVTGAGNVGIAALNSAAGTDVTIDSSAGAVAGASNGVIAQNYGTGSTFVTTADVSTQNGGSSEGGGIGIFATTGSDGQDLIVDSTAGSVNSAETGIYARGSGTGETSIMAADIVSEGGNGVFTRAYGTDLTINSTAGSVIGARSGIVATNQGSGALSIVTANVTGDENNGISGTNEGTDLTIDSRAGTVSGETTGINGNNSGSGALTIVSADVDGGTDGILAFSSGTDLTIDSTAGTVVGDRGIFGQNAGTGALSITTGDVTADGDTGIAAVNAGTDLVVDSTAGSIASSGVGTYVTGVYARNSGTGSTVITTADISSTNGFGIDAVNSEAGSDLTIDSTAGSLTVGNDGIAATNRGTGALSIITGSILSSDGTGIAATNQGGGLAINTLAGTVQGAVAGITASNDGSDALSIVTANVIGTAGDGIYATSSDAAMTIDTTGGAVMGADDGIDARNYGAGDLTIVSANVEGSGDAGIKAINTGGATSIDSSAGTVIGTNAGIFADQHNDAALTLFVNEVTGATGVDTQAMNGLTEITLASTAIVMSTQGAAVDAVSTGGDVVVQGSSGTVTGASDGIFVRSGGGDIAIATIDLVEGLAGSGLNLASAGGDIDVTGVDAIVGAAGSGILAVAASGNIDIADNGDITGTVAAITASTTGGGDIDITVSGTTIGDAFGVDVSTEGEAVRLTNSGTLQGGTFAVIASGAQTGAITLRNDGTVAQAISFGAADDRFDNRDVFSANGVSDFGDGVDELVNSGAVSVFGAAEFQRLEQFNHSGMITLVDGVAGGSLTTSGDFVGNGGTLALDVDFASSSADVLTIGGAATGTTQIVVNPLDLSATFADDLVLVNAGVGTEAGAFVIAADGAAASPFLAFELAFDAANNDFLFGIALEPKAFEATKLGEGAQALWYRSADAWSDHRSNARSDTKDNHAPAWAVLYGAESERDENFADPTGLATGGVVLDYTQDFYGIQTGLETWVSDGLVLGVTGGYLNSSLNLEESGASATFDVLNIGASISFASNGFFGEALIKYDDISGEVSDPLVGGFNGELDGSAFGGRAEFGYRTPGEGFYAEPKVSLEYQRTDLDSLVISGQRFDFEEFDGLRAGAGVRLGTSSDFGANSRLGLYLDASILHEFEGDGLTRFSSALDDIAFTNEGLDTYGRVEAGVTLDGDGPVSGFFKAETDIGSEFSSFGGSVGVRIRF